MIINNLPYIMLRALICTIIIEVCVALLLKVRNKKDILNIVLVNCLTNPLVTSIPVYVNIRYGVMQRHVTLGTLEIITLIVEGYIYLKVLNYKKINPFILSLILNLSSYLIGNIINYLF